MTEPIFSDQEIEKFRQIWFEEFGEQMWIQRDYELIGSYEQSLFL